MDCIWKMKNIEEDLSQWKTIALNNSVDNISIYIGVIDEIIERIANLKDEILNQKNRADLNYEVAMFYDGIAQNWFVEAERLATEIVDLTDEIL